MLGFCAKFLKSGTVVLSQSLRFSKDTTGKMKFLPLVVSGPSGSGKSTLVKRLMDEYPDSFAFSVSHTTRKPRQGEVNGQDYHFVSRQDMEKAIANNEFIEFAEFSANLYGTSKKAVSDIQGLGKICILDVEVQGVKNIKKSDLRARYVFIRAPSLNALEMRLRKRGTETEESLQLRLKTAQEALDYAEIPGSYDCIIENNDLEKAYSEFKAIVINDIKDVQGRSSDLGKSG